jgi:metal-responsive CopG/Arc/MetJ family transcriptional regulator
VLGKETVYTAMRLPALLSKAIDKWAEVVGVSRSEAIRQLIEAGLKRRPKP